VISPILIEEKHLPFLWNQSITTYAANILGYKLAKINVNGVKCHDFNRMKEQPTEQNISMHLW
jgi:hypothetical protein